MRDRNRDRKEIKDSYSQKNEKMMFEFELGTKKSSQVKSTKDHSQKIKSKSSSIVCLSSSSMDA